MTERLIIRNFAGLDIDVELGCINIFIGPQASGKSVCAKCLYYFKSFFQELIISVNSGQNKRTFEAQFLNRFKEYFPSIWRDETLLLRYEAVDIFVQINYHEGHLCLTYSDLFQQAEEARKEFRKARDQFNSALNTPKSLELLFSAQPPSLERIRNHFYEQVGYAMEADQLFILAGRSFYMAMKDSIISFLVNTGPIQDPLLRLFFQRYEQIRRRQPIESIPTKKLWDLAKHIIKGQPAVEDNEDYIISLDGRRVRLANASSGQQEAYPLLLLLLSLVFEDDSQITDEQTVVYIEEPEAHLFPESQRVLASFISQVYHDSPLFLRYVITTHSPYLLASFNNLIYAHQLAETLRDQPDKLKALNKVVPKNQQLALADVRVYGFENGGVKSLIDEETGLITANLLDSASDVTADQFGALMELDPAIHP